MNAAHTPGPWRATTGSDGHFVTAGSTPITPLEWLKPEDARLIAAAPELLESLEAYGLPYSDADLAILANSDTGTGEVSPQTARREIRRRAAIAKAKGEPA